MKLYRVSAWLNGYAEVLPQPCADAQFADFSARATVVLGYAFAERSRMPTSPSWTRSFRPVAQD